jgi:hypothetical protein
MNPVICLDSRYGGACQIHKRIIFEEKVIASDLSEKWGDLDDNIELF